MSWIRLCLNLGGGSLFLLYGFLVLVPFVSAQNRLKPTTFSELQNFSTTRDVSDYFSFSLPSTSMPIFTNSCGNKDFDRTVPWPKLEKGDKSLTVGFLTMIRGEITEKLGLKIPGMMSYAIERVNEEKLLPQDYKLQVKVYDTWGDEVKSTGFVTELICAGISAIIGPENTCWVESTIAEANNLPMISYSCPDERASKRKTFARTNPSEIHKLRVTVDTLIYFGWRKFSIIYEDSGFSSLVTTLENLVKDKKNFTINHKKSFKKMEELPNIFLTTKSTTRIYVLICHRIEVPKILLAMTIAGLLKVNQKKYFLLFVDSEEFKQESWTDYIFKPMLLDRYKFSKDVDCLYKDLQTYEGSFMVVSNAIPKVNISPIADTTRKYNKNKPFCLMSDVSDTYMTKQVSSRRNITANTHVPFLPASHLFDAVYQYASAVRRVYDDLVDTASRNGNDSYVPNMEEIGRDGLKIAAALTNHTFESILGYNVSMGPNRESEGSYSVYFFNSSDECAKPIYGTHLNCSNHCLVEVSEFKNNTLHFNLELEFVDEPMCGYDDEKCPTTVTDVRLILLNLLTVFVILIAFYSMVKYRHWKYEQEISGLQWRINKHDLEPINNPLDMNQSRASLSSAVQETSQQLYYSHICDFRGTYVCIKRIATETKKQELNRETMKKMRTMRDIKHRNVCPFIGAYVDEKALTLVTEYSVRGSLEDILEIEENVLDEMFISSLILDLIRGMTYLHQCFAHGSLKSTNCVITGRWVLQVTDYHLNEMRYEALKKEMEDPHSFEDQSSKKKFMKSQLWRAPELLREGPGAPGTKEGDVYSFAIILHEIVARMGPFSTSFNETSEYYHIKDIVNEVKAGQTKTGVPRRPVLTDMDRSLLGRDEDLHKTMKACWAEDPTLRPDFKGIGVRLKKMKKTGNLMDNMVNLLEVHNKNLESLVQLKTKALRDEKNKTENFLYSILPRPIANSLLRDMAVEPQSYDSVTIYFSDIVGFTSLSAASTPYEVVQFLHDLYVEFDTTISGFDVYKVETIGDAYMVASGLPNINANHAGEIASMSLELLEKTKHFRIHHKPDQTLKLRIGLHTGPVIAAVVGRTMPRYCLFGDTVNTAARMESNGEPLRIHISEQCQNALVEIGGYEIEERGMVAMKGKGEVRTFWLVSAGCGAIERKESTEPSFNYFTPFDNFNIIEPRRRSPRLSIAADMRPPSLASRSIGEYEEKSPRGSLSLLPVHPWQHLTHNPEKSNSLDSPCSLKRVLLSPPKRAATTHSIRTPSQTSMVRECHSMENIHSTPSPKILFSVPEFRKRISISPPSYSEPTLPRDGEDSPQRGVNFSSSAKYRDEDGNDSEVPEDAPMLNRSRTQEDNDNIPNNARLPRMSDIIGEGQHHRSSSMSAVAFVQGIFKRGSIFRGSFRSEEKPTTLNGVQVESRV